MKITSERFLAVYSGVLTIVFVAVVLGGAAKSASNGNFDQITVRRINIVEPNGLVRMVLSDNAEFPGAYFRGKEYPRPDRDVTGMVFNNDEGTENGGLVFGGKKDASGTHSWGHLSFDEYERDQTLVMESSSDGASRNTYYAVNDDDRPYSLTPQYNADWQRAKAMPPGQERIAAGRALRAKYPGDIVNRAYLGRGRDKSVSFILKDRQGKERLTARVMADGTPVIEFRDAAGKVTRTIGANSN